MLADGSGVVVTGRVPARGPVTEVRAAEEHVVIQDRRATAQCHHRDGLRLRRRDAVLLFAELPADVAEPSALQLWDHQRRIGLLMSKFLELSLDLLDLPARIEVRAIE